MRHALAGIVLACGAGLLVTACSASGTQSDVAAQEPSPPAQGATAPATTVPPTTPAPAASSASTTDAATGTVTDSDGNKVSFTVSTGQPESLSSTTDQIAHACDDALQSLSLLPSSAVIYPIDLTWTLESSVPATIAMGYQPYYMVSATGYDATNGILSAGAAELSSGAGPVSQESGNVSNGSSCLTDDTVDGDGGTGIVTWQNQDQDATGTLDGYLIIAGVITPDNPTGLSNNPDGQSDSAGPILIQPTITINGDGEVNETYSYGSTDSTNLLQCASASFGVQPETYIALDPSDAIANGCTK